MAKRTVEDELVEAAQRALTDETLTHPIVGVGIAIAYKEGPPGLIVLAPGQLETLLAAVSRLEHQVNKAIDDEAKGRKET